MSKSTSSTVFPSSDVLRSIMDKLQLLSDLHGFPHTYVLTQSATSLQANKDAAATRYRTTQAAYELANKHVDNLRLTRSSPSRDDTDSADIILGIADRQLKQARDTYAYAKELHQDGLQESVRYAAYLKEVTLALGDNYLALIGSTPLGIDPGRHVLCKTIPDIIARHLKTQPKISQAVAYSELTRTFTQHQLILSNTLSNQIVSLYDDLVILQSRLTLGGQDLLLTDDRLFEAIVEAIPATHDGLLTTRDKVAALFATTSTLDEIRRTLILELPPIVANLPAHPAPIVLAATMVPPLPPPVLCSKCQAPISAKLPIPTTANECKKLVTTHLRSKSGHCLIHGSGCTRHTLSSCFSFLKVYFELLPTPASQDKIFRAQAESAKTAADVSGTPWTAALITAAAF